MRKRTLSAGSLFGLSLLITAQAAQAAPASGATPLPSVITKWLKNVPSKKTVLPTRQKMQKVLKKEFQRTAVVARKGGDYSSPVTAMNKLASWCGTPSETNVCLLLIGPGLYDLAGASLTMQPYVDIQGSGEGSTIISSAANSGVVNLADSTELGFLTVQNTAESGTVMAIRNEGGGTATITHVTAIASGHGDENYAIFSLLSGQTLNFVTATAVGAASNIAVYLGASGAQMDNVTAYAAGGNDTFAVVAAASSAFMNNITADAWGNVNGYGIYLADSGVDLRNSNITARGGVSCYGTYNAYASVIMTNVTTTAWGVGSSYGLYNTSAPSSVQADRCTFEGGTNSVYTDGSSVQIGGSKLSGPAVSSNDSTLTCINSYNGNYTAVGANCQ